MASNPWLLSGAILALVTAVPGQDPASQPAGTPASRPASEPPTVAILGASVSGGFANFMTGGMSDRNRTIRLSAALRKLWPRGEAWIRDYSDVNMFLKPIESGENKAARALRAEPDLVIAIDFMFWFGYGYARGASEEAVQRLDLQRRGLELLEKFECPIIVGDYPDMRGADRRMLSPRQIPEPKALARLNERLDEWAKARSNVRVFRLSDWVVRAKKGDARVEVDGETVALPTERLLQSDLLHATRLGVAFLTTGLVPLVEDVLPDGHALLRELPDNAAIFERLRVDLPQPAVTETAGAGSDK